MKIIDTLTQRLNIIILKIVSISDEVLKQQLCDEYLDVKLMINEKTLTLYELYLMYTLQLEYYKAQYMICLPTEVLPNTSMQRLRQITTLLNKRTIIPYLKANN